jgi:hypothetical protein
MNEFEQLPINHLNWKDVPREEIGYSGEHLDISPLYRHTAETGQQFNVLKIDGRVEGKGPVIIVPLPYDIRIDTSVLHSMSILATQMKACVYAVETPGVTVDHSDPDNTAGDRLTGLQTIEALMGSSENVTHEQFRAVDKVAKFADGQEVQLAGVSRANNSVAVMAAGIVEDRYEKSLRVSNVDTIEPVNIHGVYSVGQLAMTLQLVENPLLAQYQAENTAIGLDDVIDLSTGLAISPKTDKLLKRRQRVPVILSGIALYSGMQKPLKRIAKASPDTEIAIVRAVHSRVSKKPDLIAAAENIRDSGGSVRLVELVPDDNDTALIAHHVTTSHGRYADYTHLANNPDARNKALRRASRHAKNIL